jgi:hypothetical protein
MFETMGVRTGPKRVEAALAALRAGDARTRYDRG